MELLNGSGRNQHRGAGHCDHADVVLLAEALRCGGHLGRGQPALQQLLQAFKAEEPALFVHGFHDAIGSQQQAVVFLQLEMSDGEAGIVGNAQWKRSFYLDLRPSVEPRQRK